MPGLFRRAPPLPPSAFLPAPRGSGTPPSANLGSRRPSSSSEAALASSRPVSPFRLPLPFLTRKSGRCRSGLRIVPRGALLEAGPGGSGVRGEGAACGRRTLRRGRSHRGPNNGGCGCCACARRRGGGSTPRSDPPAAGPRPSGLRRGGRRAPGEAAEGRPRRASAGRGARELGRRRVGRPPRRWSAQGGELPSGARRGGPGRSRDLREGRAPPRPGGARAGAEEGARLRAWALNADRAGGGRGSSRCVLASCFPPPAGPSPPSLRFPFFSSSSSSSPKSFGEGKFARTFCVCLKAQGVPDAAAANCTSQSAAGTARHWHAGPS
ncbi:translation initiation factor IF-2-like [Vulpes lagopus]|uniref:translation initiation factor IF-2-like n=1 Tax=Vulpes lagopus TaxID=494514 RepID=UPI001BC8EFC9|nr:translation initiation factor IF-2-like [Vulpes lagopus]